MGLKENIKFHGFLRDAKKGNAIAQYNAGNCYLFGRGVAADFTEAFRWFTKAAAQNYHGGYYGLGNCYEVGASVEINLNTALEYYKKAEMLGNPLASEGVFRMNEELGTGNDAESLYRTAREHYFKKGATQNDIDIAVAYAEKAAAAGDARAQDLLGNIFFVEEYHLDWQRAFEFSLKAAARGIGNAQYRVARLYEDGKGTPKNSSEALKWYRKAAENGVEAAKKDVARFTPPPQKPTQKPITPAAKPTTSVAKPTVSAPKPSNPTIPKSNSVASATKTAVSVTKPAATKPAAVSVGKATSAAKPAPKANADTETKEFEYAKVGYWAYNPGSPKKWYAFKVEYINNLLNPQRSYGNTLDPYSDQYERIYEIHYCTLRSALIEAITAVKEAYDFFSDDNKRTSVLYKEIQALGATFHNIDAHRGKFVPTNALPTCPERMKPLFEELEMIMRARRGTGWQSAVEGCMEADKKIEEVKKRIDKAVGHLGAETVCSLARGAKREAINFTKIEF